MYILETGMLTVHYEDEKNRLRLAPVVAGPRSAKALSSLASHATPPCRRRARGKIWSLTPIRFTDLINRQPAMAVEIAMALGALVSRRLTNEPKRIAVT